MKFLPTRIDLIKLLPSGSVGAEIGVWRGYFSSEILGCHNVGKLYSIDNWGPYLNEDQRANEQEARGNLKRFGGRSAVVKTHSLKAVSEVPDLDFVFIDGYHTYEACTADLEAWAKKIKPNGCIMGHDYTDRPEARAMNFGVIRAVDDFCENKGWEMIYLTQDDWPSYMLVRKTWRGAEL